jgi:hypothetical protein
LSENMMERGNNGDLRIVQEIECEFVGWIQLIQDEHWIQLIQNGGLVMGFS